MEGNRFDDAGMKYIGSLTSLEQLYLKDPSISDEGLKYLQNLINLETLFIPGYDISDAALQYLKPLTKLKHLDLRGTGVTPDGVQRIAEVAAERRGLPALESSELKGTGIIVSRFAQRSRVRSGPNWPLSNGTNL